MIDQDWETAPAVGHKFGSMVIDIQTRELTRRNALCSLDNPDQHEQATQDLLRVWRADRDYPIGSAADLTAEEIGAQVPTVVEEGAGALVRFSEIPEPWATRFQVASLGATRALDGYFARDWEKFLELWPAEAEKVEDLVERELERPVIIGIQKAQARRAATLASAGSSAFSNRADASVRMPNRIDTIVSKLEDGELSVRVSPFSDRQDRSWLGGLVSRGIDTAVALTAVILAIELGLILLAMAGFPVLEYVVPPSWLAILAEVF